MDNSFESFVCPFCKNQTWLTRLKIKPESYDDLIGATCTNCGHRISDEDIKRSTLGVINAILERLKFKR